MSLDTAIKSTEVTQATHDNLNLNANLQIANADAPGGAGAVTANVPRVTHASDDPAVVALQIIDNAISGSGVNVSQINGVTPLMGSGATGTGSPRVTAATDSPEVTSLAVIDDWDETDRCKVNVIVGQAGIAAGTGVDGVTVPRVTLATNVALPAGTNAIGKLSANSGVDIGDVDVTSVPADPFGVNADAASATGSISAKLRFIASTGIPITGTVTVGSHAVTNAGTFVVQENGAALTALQLIDNAVSGSGFNITQLNGVNITMGNGVSGTGVQRVTLASDSTGTVIATYTAPTNDTSSAYEASSVTKASAGTLWGFSGYNSKTADQFIMFFNSTSVPADATAAVLVWRVAALSPFSLDLGVRGRAFSTGIAWSNSSTSPTKTIGSADVFMDVQYT